MPQYWTGREVEYPIISRQGLAIPEPLRPFLHLKMHLPPNNLPPDPTKTRILHVSPHRLRLIQHVYRYSYSLYFWQNFNIANKFNDFFKDHVKYSAFL